MPRTGEFRLNAKKLFLTYPQNDCSKEEALRNLKEFFGEENIECGVVARELHEDGNPHLHCFLILKEKCDIQTASALDVITGKHGNYQSMKQVKNCYEYNVKEDMEPAKFGNCAIFEKKKPKWEEIAEMLDSGATLKQVRESHKSMYIQHRSKILDYYSDIHDKERDPDEEVEVIVFWGQAGTGKSKAVYKRWPGALYKDDLDVNKFWDRYEGQETVVINDFRGHKMRLDALLNMIDRFPQVKEIKGMRRGINLNVKRWVFTSNYHPKDWYKGWDSEKLSRRITQIVEFTMPVGNVNRKPVEMVYNHEWDDFESPSVLNFGLNHFDISDDEQK